MTKHYVTQLLEDKHQYFFDWYNQNENSWEEGPENKWSAGQHTVHLINSIKPLILALSTPKFILKLLYGKLKRTQLDYNALASNYRENLILKDKLAKKIGANTKTTTLNEKVEMLNTLDELKNKLIQKLNKWSKEDLENICLPHPLLGKLSVIEVLAWTAYHTEYHADLLRKNYSK